MTSFDNPASSTVVSPCLKQISCALKRASIFSSLEMFPNALSIKDIGPSISTPVSFPFSITTVPFFDLVLTSILATSRAF